MLRRGQEAVERRGGCQGKGKEEEGDGGVGGGGGVRDEEGNFAEGREWKMGLGQMNGNHLYGSVTVVSTFLVVPAPCHTKGICNRHLNLHSCTSDKTSAVHCVSPDLDSSVEILQKHDRNLWQGSKWTRILDQFAETHHVLLQGTKSDAPRFLW